MSIVIGLVAFFVIAWNMKPSNPQAWGELWKIFGVFLTFLASVMTTIGTLVVANWQLKTTRCIQLEVARYQRLTESIKIALPQERLAYSDLYKAAMNVFHALRPLENGQFEKTKIEGAKKEFEKVKTSFLLLGLNEHRTLWKQIMQSIEYITGEVEKLQAEIDSPQSDPKTTAFWLDKSVDFAAKIQAFENAAIGRLQVHD
jgi:hypothetical protein